MAEKRTVTLHIRIEEALADALKAIALANGFWHMGEFRTLYRDLFGETPQQTLEAARGQ